MRRRRRVTPVALLAVALLAGLAALDRGGLLGSRQGSDAARYDGQQCKVVHNVDGDTLAVGVSDGHSPTTTIRLWGVDTPETKKPNTPVQHFGPEASDFTRSLTAEQTVRLQLVPGDTRDKYGRLLAYVFLPDGRMLNRLLLEGGFAYADPRYPHPYKAEFASLMKRAQRAQVGLWAQVRPEELPYYLRDTSAATAAK